MKMLKLSEVRFNHFRTFDYQPFLEVEKYFQYGDHVVVTEKLRSNQVIIGRDLDGQIVVTSRHLAHQGLLLPEFHEETFVEKLQRWTMGKNEPPRTFFWQAARNSYIPQMLAQWPSNGTEILIYGVTTPSWAPGFPYSAEEEPPNVLIEGISLDGKMQDYRTFLPRWTPMLDYGPWDPERQLPMAKGREQISGAQLHDRDGVIIRHVNLKYMPDGRPVIAVVYPKDIEEWLNK